MPSASASVSMSSSYGACCSVCTPVPSTAKSTWSTSRPGTLHLEVRGAGDGRARRAASRGWRAGRAWARPAAGGCWMPSAAWIAAASAALGQRRLGRERRRRGAEDARLRDRFDLRAPPSCGRRRPLPPTRQGGSRARADTCEGCGGDSPDDGNRACGLAASPEKVPQSAPHRRALCGRSGPVPGPGTTVF